MAGATQADPLHGGASQGGAVLALAQPQLALPPPSAGQPSSSARIGVRLSAAAGQRVTARLELLLPTGASAGNASGGASTPGWAPADPERGLWLEPATLSWRSWQRGTQDVQLHSASHLPLAVALRDALGGSAPGGGSGAGAASGGGQGLEALARVQLVSATGAAIMQPRSATTLVVRSSSGGSSESSGSSGGRGDAGGGVTGEPAPAPAPGPAPAPAPEPDDRPLFGFVANQVAYAPAAGQAAAPARIPVRLLAGALRAPATLRYSLALLPAGEEAPPAAGTAAAASARAALARVLPTHAVHGFLQFKPPPPAAGASAQQQQQQEGQQQQQQWVAVPLHWGHVAPEAQLRIGERSRRIA